MSSLPVRPNLIEAGQVAAGHWGTRPGRFAKAVLACVASAAVALPLLATETPPLFDYPNHLSRAYVLADPQASETFRTWFDPAGLLIPNVSVDVALVALMRIVDAETAGRILLAAIGWATIGGAVALGRAASGRFQPWPLFAALVVFNEMLFWGFLNYMLGLALMLWGLAAWIAFGRTSRRLQLAAGAVFGLAIFFSHLVAFALYAVAIGIFEFAGIDWRGMWSGPSTVRPSTTVAMRLGGSALIFLPPVLLFFWASPASDLPAALRFNFTLFEKLSPFTRLLSSGNPVMDALVLLSAAALLAAFAIFGRVGVDRRLGLTASAFALCLLLLPYSAMGSFFVDARIAIAVVLILLCGLRTRRPTGRAEMFTCVGLVLLVGIRTAALVQQWSSSDLEYRAILAGIDRIQSGSVLIAATGTPFEYGTGWFYTRTNNPSHEHTASYATIRRDAVVPAIFAKAGQNPLLFTPPSKSVSEIALGPIPRLSGPNDMRALARRALAARAELDRAGRASQRIYVIAYDVVCGDWPSRLGLRPTVCGATFSILEAVRPVPSRRSRGRPSFGSSGGVNAPPAVPPFKSRS